jgi:hypothetical protein
MTHEYSIAVLCPTRGRTSPLSLAIKSVVNRADNPNQIQLLLGFDNDDAVGLKHFKEDLQPWLDEKGITYTALQFERLGYAGLNRYYNGLAEHSDADWFLSWSDDAVMETQGWDSVMTSYNGQFKLLKAHAHNEHPYSIFPMWPREWYDLFGHCSRHQMIDAELSQMAYMLDLIEIVPIYITHNRPDVVKGESDSTHKERVLFEGNPYNPQDFHNVNFITAREKDCEIIAEYLRSKNIDTSWWEGVVARKNNPWTKMHENDPNGQMTQIRVPR